ncbi:MAG TPA: histidine kinase dimerization/phospho-acceptor domain-containing protein, partial [Pseudonocardiaceae bacterium]
MTLAAVVLVAIGTLVLGLVSGFLIGHRAGGGSGSRPGTTVADLVQRVVLSSHNGVVLLDPRGEVVLANPPARKLGLVSGSRPDERARRAAEQVRASGQVVHVDLSPLDQGRGSGRGPTAVLGEVRPLGDEFTVVDASDESDAVRLEATRRDFVANVSHELKTPVGAMALLAEAVLDAADDPHEVRR